MSTNNVLPSTLKVDMGLTPTGMIVKINEDHFPIVYEKNIWNKYPISKKKILMDNIAYSSTIFLPQMLELKSIFYNTSRPLSETFLYKNGIYDMPICAETDKKSSVDYILRFFNTRQNFKNSEIRVPDLIEFKSKSKHKKTAIIPFSFGKESMLSFALCQELGIQPILVNFIEPVNEYNGSIKLDR